VDNKAERIKAFAKSKNCSVYYSVQFFKEPRAYSHELGEVDEIWTCEIHEGDAYVYLVARSWPELTEKVESKLEAFGYTRE
jgi:hypothetical protein